MLRKGRFGTGNARNVSEAVRCERDRCMLCAGCVPLCAHGALTVAGTGLNIDASACRACGDCVRGCPTGALALRADDGGVGCPQD